MNTPVVRSIIRYRIHRIDPLPHFAKQTEWEDDYPLWSDLSVVAQQEIDLIKNGTQYDFEALLEVISIDNESEQILKGFEDDLQESIFMEFVDQGLKSIFPEARAQVVGMIFRRNELDSEKLLESITYNDDDLAVKMTALDYLCSINIEKARNITLFLFEKGDLKTRLNCYLVFMSMGDLKNAQSLKSKIEERSQQTGSSTKARNGKQS